MKKGLIICLVVIAFFAAVAIFLQHRSSEWTKKKYQQDFLLENEYQEGIKQISEGRFHDAMKSLANPASVKHKHAVLLYLYAQTKATNDPFYIKGFVPESYNGPFAEEILA